MNFAAVVGPLRKLLEELLAGTKCTKRVENNRILREEDWTMERAIAWLAAKNMIFESCMLDMRWDELEEGVTYVEAKYFDYLMPASVI